MVNLSCHIKKMSFDLRTQVQIPQIVGCDLTLKIMYCYTLVKTKDMIMINNLLFAIL